jgi:hypothetical protein
MGVYGTNEMDSRQYELQDIGRYFPSFCINRLSNLTKDFRENVIGLFAKSPRRASGNEIIPCSATF